MADYPEHDKLKKVQEESQQIGDFLAWAAHEKSLRLCDFIHNGTELAWQPTDMQVTRLLADYFEIDLDRLEEEKRLMLEELKA